MAQLRQAPFKKGKAKMVAVRSFVRSGVRSCYLTVPVDMIEFLGWTIDDYLKLTAEKGKIILEKLVIEG